MAGGVPRQAASSFKFYYDIVCPFAYIASTKVERLAEKANSSVIWTPVLLGGLYEGTHASQGKEGSATDVMSPAKLKISGQDLHRQMARYGVSYKEPLIHPQKTVTAMRLLSAIQDDTVRVSISHALYQAYWSEQKDVTNLDTLQEVAAPYGVNVSQLLGLDTASQTLRANTSEAVERGAFGVPSFYVGNDVFWGTDRMFFVERTLGLDSDPERIAPTPSHGSSHLSFFFDYASPWSFLAMERMKDLLCSVQPVNVKIEWIPILLGALFKEIGTPMVPAAAMAETKRNYFKKDLQDWCTYAGVKLRWPHTFPLRTVLPLRVTLASGCNPQLIARIYRAAWQENKDIGDPKILEDVLKEVPVDACTLLSKAQSPSVKASLFANTKRAVEDGVCGVPSFQVNGSEVVWGQDKMNVVADMLCGWQTPFKNPAKL